MNWTPDRDIRQHLSKFPKTDYLIEQNNFPHVYLMTLRVPGFIKDKWTVAVWKLKSFKKVAVVLCMFFTLAACNKLDKGTVTQKWYEPETIYVQYMYIYNGKDMIMIPYIVVDAEDYCVKIKGTYKGKERSETVYVPATTYDCLNIGSTLVVGKDCSFSDNNNTKEKQ